MKVFSSNINFVSSPEVTVQENDVCFIELRICVHRKHSRPHSRQIKEEYAGVSGHVFCHSHTAQHNTTQHNTTQHNTTQHNTTQHNTTQHNTTQQTQHNTTTQHNSER